MARVKFHPFRRMFGSIIVSAVSRRMRAQGVSRKDIEEFLEDETLQDAAIDEVEQRYDGPREKGQFLTWLSEHIDEIIKIVMTLMALFAEQPPAENPEALGDQLLADFHPVTGPEVFNG